MPEQNAAAARRVQAGESQATENTRPKLTISKKAADIAPKVRELAVREFRYYGSTKRMQRRDGLSRSDVQDLVLLGLMDEMRRLRPLQKRRKK
jgi:hypothetical protein